MAQVELAGAIVLWAMAAGSNPIVVLAALAAGPHRLVRFSPFRRPPAIPEEVSRTLMTNVRISNGGLVPANAAFRRATVLLAH